ncbi:MAG: hypothetical protein M1360_00190 [Candidatus Marsarchaeota archaeon]|jgi:hypothetical protein|nr:hypothetical protein [Candidatus Marsarchaeota archaeon]MCL5418348.1 hypothetical protein [Candidatus Marsarchaeota archaeon]
MKMKSAILALAILFAFAAYANGTYVNVVEPYNATINPNGSIFLGNVGPGEPFYITISSATTNRSGAFLDYGWNQFVAYGLPPGWVVVNSALNVPQLSVKITASPQAQNGTYKFYLKAINTGNYSKIGNLTFSALVNVTPNVFNLNVYPSSISVGPGQPALIHIGINNTGVSDSPFTISVSGAPAWSYEETVIAPHSTSKTFAYSIYEDEPGLYKLRLAVNSSASSLVSKTVGIDMLVKASIPNDYSAIGQGAIAFPNIYAPAYSVMYLIDKLARSLA